MDKEAVVHNEAKQMDRNVKGDMLWLLGRVGEYFSCAGAPEWVCS